MPKKILIIDDDTSQREIYAEIFSTSGYAVREAENGLEGLAMIGQDKPDVILSGIMMPKMDGFELIKHLKSQVETKDIPICIFSHLGREEDRTTSEKLGAAEFFVKGLNGPKEILEKVGKIFTRKSYKVKIDPTQLDAEKLMSEHHLKEITLTLVPEFLNGRLIFKIEQ